MKISIILCFLTLLGSVKAQSNGTCNPIKDESSCLSTGCFFCSNNKCRVSCESNSGGGNGGGDGGDEPVDGTASNGICNPIKSQPDCDIQGCNWCADKGKCRISSQRCPGSNANSIASGLAENVKCNPIKDATACGDAGCFYCEKNGNGFCRATESKCPLGGTGNAFGSSLCQSFKGNESGCEEVGCVFCGGSSAQCHFDEASCPGQGRSSPCMNLGETDCSSSEDCLWCSEGNVCTSARGGTCASAGLPPGNLCKQYTSEPDCTLGETTNCRWCPFNSKCKNADDACDDGEVGFRGNPCKSVVTTEGCTAIEGCLWCEGNSKCKKAEDGCDEDDEGENAGGAEDEGAGDADGGLGVPCFKLIFATDCEANPSCQYCPQEKTCNQMNKFCGVATATVAMEIEYGSPKFEVRNQGLGESDPSAVQVVLNYLFEVGEDGREIPFSFVDVQNQDFTVTQTEGAYLGVLARKVTFTAEISGVGSIELVVYKILEDGTVATPSREVFEVAAGDIKFNVNLANWSFCDEDETGICADSGSAAFIDIAMTIKGSADTPELDETDGSIFDLGGGVPLVLTNQVEIDGIIDAMPPGFPRIEQTPNEEVFFVFRFPRFANSLVYDPIVGSGTLIVSDAVTLAPVSVPTIGLRPTDAPAETPSSPTTTTSDSGANLLTLLMPSAVCLVALWF